MLDYFCTLLYIVCGPGVPFLSFDLCKVCWSNRSLNNFAWITAFARLHWKRSSRIRESSPKRGGLWCWGNKLVCWIRKHMMLQCCSENLLHHHHHHHHHHHLHWLSDFCGEIAHLTCGMQETVCFRGEPESSRYHDIHSKKTCLKDA